MSSLSTAGLTSFASSEKNVADMYTFNNNIVLYDISDTVK